MKERTETHQEKSNPSAKARSAGRNGDQEPSSMAIEVATLRVHIDHILTAINNINTRMDRLEDAVNESRKELKGEIGELRKEANTRFYWIMSMFAALLAVMAKGFGWLG